VPVIRVKLGKVPVALLRQLHETGLWGFTIEDTVEHLILGRLREFLQEGDRMLRLPKVRKAARRNRKVR